MRKEYELSGVCSVRRGMLYLFDTLFQLFAGHGNISAAASADYTHIAANAQNGVMLFAAGMGLFHFKHIPDADSGYDRHMLPPADFYGRFICADNHIILSYSIPHSACDVKKYRQLFFIL